MSENVVTWGDLTVVLQETLQAIVEGKWVFTPNALKLQDMGLVQRDFSDTSFVVFAPTPAGLAIMPTAAQPSHDIARLQAENARLRSEVEQRTAVIYGEGYSEGYSDGEKDMQVENKRLREWRQLALTFAQRQYRISVSNSECHIPLLDWDLFRDTAQELVKQEKALGGE